MLRPEVKTLVVCIRDRCKGRNNGPNGSISSGGEGGTFARGDDVGALLEYCTHLEELHFGGTKLGYKDFGGGGESSRADVVVEAASRLPALRELSILAQSTTVGTGATYQSLITCVFPYSRFFFLLAELFDVFTEHSVVGLASELSA